MSGAGEGPFSLTLMTNKEKTKVLFALVDGAFVDVLLSFLTLPLGRILRLLKIHYGDEAPTIGSLNTLYDGLRNLDREYFGTDAGKQMLLDPRSSLEDECRNLKVSLHDTQPTKYFICECWGYNRVSLYHQGAICECGQLLNREIKVKDVTDHAAECNGSQVFAKKTVSFLLSDDLRMMTGSIMQSLASLGVVNIDETEHTTVRLGFDEMIDLLKGSLLSKTPLTDIFLQKSQCHDKLKSPLPFSLLPEVKKEEICSSKKMTIKTMVQKSTNKFLFAQTEEDFVDFLFSMLTIPLGQVEFLLNMNTSLGCVDNLYKSVMDINVKYLITPERKESLLKPKLPPMSLSENHIFSLSEEETPELYYHKNKNMIRNDFLSFNKHPTRSYNSAAVVFVDPKGTGSFLKETGMFMVTDDLTVKPLFMLSSLSNLKELKIPLSDVEEIEITIGLEEAKSILKASLTSACPISTGLNLNTKKQIKQEKMRPLIF